MKKNILSFALIIALCGSLAETSRADGTNNPTGVTGEYNGSVTTAGSYDIFTGNAKRFITDLSVTGAVGAFPLKWTRVLNTRGGMAGPLGQGGQWAHSYQWGLALFHTPPPSDPTNEYGGPAGHIDYPDGRIVDLQTQDEVNYAPVKPYEGADRVQPAGGGNYDLLLHEGGIVHFTHPAGSTSGGDLRATSIEDSNRQTTVLVYDAAGRLSTVTEPAGRYLQINWTTYSYQRTYPFPQTIYTDVIANVQAFGGPGNLMETVTYSYTPENVQTEYDTITWYNLTQVNYDDGTYSSYTYFPSYTQTSNGQTFSARIKSCDDPRFDGPMRRIEYEYLTNAEYGGAQAPVGVVKKEKNLTTHQTVSEAIYPVFCFNPPSADPSYFQRTESRPDGATRSFQYTVLDGELQSYTDYKNNTSSIQFGPSAFGYSKLLTDARGYTTTVEKEPLVGAVMKVTHPGDNSTVEFTYSDSNNPYYIASRKDERGYITYHDRDANNRIWRTRYPDNSSEQFTSYNSFGQILTHLMTSGGTETFTYDGRGLKTSQTDPYGNVTHYNYYQNGPNTDRLLNVVDPRGNATWYEYNGRGEVTKLTHQDGSYVQSTYNPDGTLATATDELGHTTSYTYDEYKRVLTVTNPLSQTTTNSYAPWSGIGPFSHTTASVYRATSPMGKITDFNYDENFRRFVVHQGVGTPADDATTVSGYDAVGNLSWVQDPRGYTTNFVYDNRNRQTSITDALGNVTSTTYDYANNKTSVTRPGNQPVQFVEYDPMNRLKHQIDERGVHTYLHYDDAARNLTSQEDGNGKTYFYAYDQMNRKISMTYPPETSGAVRSESWTYDPAGNLATHTNRAGAVQTFAQYDNRNRATSFSWSDGTQGQSFAYDLTSKVTALHNAEADIVNTYDAANRHTSETETIKSYGLWATRSTVYQYDADGNRSRLTFPQGYQFIYGYTQRNQLDNIKLDPAIFGGYYNTPVVRYTYDASGNHTTRTVLSGAHAEYDVDELNRVRGQSDYFANWQMGRFDYGFDALGRHRYEQRDWGTTDGYQYDPSDEVTGYQRDGNLNGDGTVSAVLGNNTTLAYDNNGNRAQVTGVGADSYTINSLNQYTSDAVTGTMGYDPKGNLTSAAGWTYSYDAQNRLKTMQGPGMTITMTYDPLNRVITRNVNGAVTQNVWEGWHLIEEHRPDWSIQRCYLQGANQNEMVAAFDGNVYSNHWYWQDGRGNTSHITGDNAALLERYTYDLSGAPTFYDEWDNERFGGSVYDTRFLFAGSQYLPETGLYDMRNRFYSPVLNRFLQTDPIGFAGDALNLYRYCGDDPVDRSDPTGLQDHPIADIVWQMACHGDSGNSLQGTFQDMMNRIQPAGMDGGGGGVGAGGEKSISSENEGRKTYNVIEIHIEGKEHPDTDNITVMGTYGQPVPAQAKTTADLGLPHASIGKDGRLHVDQNLHLDTYFPRGASEALKNEERKRPGSLIGWANDRYPDLVKSLRTTSFKDFGGAEKAVDNAVRKDYNSYRARTKLDFDFRPEGQPSL